MGYFSKAKHQWADHIMRRTTTDRHQVWIGSLAKQNVLEGGRPPTETADVFVAWTDQLNSQLVTIMDLDLGTSSVQYQHRGRR
ncbi:unnamed protein product [Strongylus vulgaris]|uniref:Uncharacterized protein n=1 Tax=Strongylus vulgaris TaxID=40348 RepID=A0A3P7ILX7_STRVU|nr:unnamed protein product [Strongylus vulgaris]